MFQNNVSYSKVEWFAFGLILRSQFPPPILIAHLKWQFHIFDLDHFYCHQFFGATQHESTISHSLLGAVPQHTANRCPRGESFLMLHVSSGNQTACLVNIDGITSNTFNFIYHIQLRFLSKVDFRMGQKVPNFIVVKMI